MRSLTAMARGDSGAAAIELGIMLPLLMLLLAGLFDLGFGAFYKMQVQAAAAAGARYAEVNGFTAADQQSKGPIAAVVQGATGTSPITASTSEFCGCPTNIGTGLQQQNLGAPPCTANSCPDGSTPSTYALVTAQYSYTTVLPYMIIPQTLNLSAQAITLVQ